MEENVRMVMYEYEDMSVGLDSCIIEMNMNSNS